MEISGLTVVVLCCVVSVYCQPQYLMCNKVSSCRCTTSDGRTIDLTPLDSKQPASPRFHDVLAPDTYTYSFNPCSDFTEGSTDCVNVAVCQDTHAGPAYYQMGNQASVSFNNDGARGLELVTHGVSAADQLTRYAHIQLICDPSIDDANFTATGENPNDLLHYMFTLTSKHCCPQRNPYTTTTIPPPKPKSTVRPAPPSVQRVFFTVNLSFTTCVFLILLVLLYLVGRRMHNKYRTVATDGQSLPTRKL